jgi:hypothetical protein
MLPETRAAFLKDAVAGFAPLGVEGAALARSRMPSSALRDIHGAKPLDWLPAAHALACLHAIESVGGEDGIRACSTAAIEATFRAPLLRAFIEAALGALRVSPGAVVRTVSRAWPLHYRHAGELVVLDDGPHALRVVHAGLPPLLRERCWMLSLATCIGRVTALAAEGAMAEPVEEDGKIVYVVRWPQP